MNITMRHKTYLVLTVFIVNVASHAEGAQSVRYATRPVGGKKMMQLRVFFTNPRSPDFATTCSAGEFVNRAIPDGLRAFTGATFRLCGTLRTLTVLMNSEYTFKVIMPGVT